MIEIDSFMQVIGDLFENSSIQIQDTVCVRTLISGRSFNRARWRDHFGSKFRMCSRSKMSHSMY